MNNEIAILKNQVFRLFEKKLKLDASRNRELYDEQKRKYTEAYEQYMNSVQQLNKQISEGEKRCSELEARVGQLDEDLKVKSEKEDKATKKVESMNSQLEELRLRAMNLRLESEKYGAVDNQITGNFYLNAIVSTFTNEAHCCLYRRISQIYKHDFWPAE